MNVQVESSGPCRRHLRIEIPADRVKAELNQVMDAYLQHAKIPGFRPGKAPRKMVEKRYEKQIHKEIKERLVPEAYQGAVKENQLRTVAVIDVDDPALTTEAPFVFNVVVDVQPEFDMPSYQSLTIKAQPVEVGDAQVEEVLTSIRSRNAKFEDAPEGAVVASGDLVSIDTDATAGGQPLADTVPELKDLVAGKDFWLFADDEQFLLKELSQGLVGLTQGAQTEMEVPFPETFPNEKVKGITGTFKVTVKGIRKKVLPEIDDAFIKELQAESLDDLNRRIREDLTRMKEDQEKQRQKNDAVRQLLDAVKMDLPESVVQEETSRNVYDIVSENSRRGVSNDEIESSREQIYQAASKSAEEAVKLKYILLAIAEAESLAVNDEQIQQRIAQMAAASRRDPKKLREDLLKDNGQGHLRLKERLLMDLALETVMQTATIQAA